MKYSIYSLLFFMLLVFTACEKNSGLEDSRIEDTTERISAEYQHSSFSFDCPDIRANFRDECRRDDGTVGYVNEDCECETRRDGNYDCPDLRANYRDACRRDDGTVGYINENCECETRRDGNYDCPDLRANYRDVCRRDDGAIGFINRNCECQTRDHDGGDHGNERERDTGGFDNGNCIELMYPLTYTMPDGSTITGSSRDEIGRAIRAWYANHPDVSERPTLQFPITVTIGRRTITVNSERELARLRTLCDERTAGEGELDCPRLRANIGDRCRTQEGTVGYVNRACECVTRSTDYDCPDRQANIGDPCLRRDGSRGTVNRACECS